MHNNMETMKCKHCGHSFKMNCPTKEGTYKVTCPFCKQDSYFKINKPDERIRIECPSCHKVITARKPENPGRYLLKCPSCEHEIRILKK